MRISRHCKLFVLSCSVAVILQPRQGLAQQNSVTPQTGPRLTLTASLWTQHRHSRQLPPSKKDRPVGLRRGTG